MATGKARKSTSSKKKVTSAIRSKLSKKTVEIDQTVSNSQFLKCYTLYRILSRAKKF
jgi:hypothetical protein